MKNNDKYTLSEKEVQYKTVTGVVPYKQKLKDTSFIPYLP